MTYFELITKIKEEKLESLPLEIRYRGDIYTRKEAAYTYYKKGEHTSDTMMIDTMDLEETVEVVKCDEIDHDKLYDLFDDLRDLLESIEDELNK